MCSDFLNVSSEITVQELVVARHSSAHLLPQALWKEAWMLGKVVQVCSGGQSSAFEARSA